MNSPIGDEVSTPRIGERLKGGPALRDRVQCVQEIASRARQAINASDEERVALAEGIDGPAQLRPVGACAALLSGVQLGRACALKLVDLSVERLTVGRNPAIPHDFRQFVTQFRIRLSDKRYAYSAGASDAGYRGPKPNGHGQARTALARAGSAAEVTALVRPLRRRNMFQT
jgi:hypothetical protein